MLKLQDEFQAVRIEGQDNLNKSFNELTERLEKIEENITIMTHLIKKEEEASRLKYESKELKESATKNFLTKIFT